MLGIPRGVSVTPIETYVAWKDNIDAEDGWLICTYHLRDDLEFIKFEKTALLGNTLFEDFKIGDDGNGIYVFNFTKYMKDWDNFLRGKYSKFSPILKNKIRNWYTGNSNLVYVDSFINPAGYYAIYAELLGVNIEHLKVGVELCPSPEISTETLIMSIKNSLEIEILNVDSNQTYEKHDVNNIILEGEGNLQDDTNG